MNEHNRSLFLIAAGIVAFTVLAVTVVLLAASPTPRDFPADTPEGTLQRYLAAHDAGDLDAAYAHFSSTVQRDTDLATYRRLVDSSGHGAPETPSRRVLFDGTDGSGDTVRVRLTVEQFYADGLEGSTIRQSYEIRMIREHGAWRIDELLMGLDPAPYVTPL